MSRTFELLIYAVVILFFIGRYSGQSVDERYPMRPMPSEPAAPRVLLPDDEALPRQDERLIRVDLGVKSENSVGTAFAVADGRTYVTARHVVEGCQQLFLATGPDRGQKVQKVTVRPGFDFAILQVKPAHKAVVSLTSAPPARGDEGYMMGFPQSKPADVRATVLGELEMRSTGRYSQREPVVAWVERERRPGFSGALSGISGGPVFNGQGDVVGTVVAGDPRRGRAYSTNPHIFEETGLVYPSDGVRQLRRATDRQNFDAIGREYRADGTIVQVYCKAG